MRTSRIQFMRSICLRCATLSVFSYHFISVPEEEEEEPLVIVSTTITPVTLYLGEPNSLFPDVTVEFEGDEGVSGTNLWEIEIFFNKNGDGSGKKSEPTTSTLTQDQKDQPLVITESLVFEVRANKVQEW